MNKFIPIAILVMLLTSSVFGQKKLGVTTIVDLPTVAYENEVGLFPGAAIGVHRKMFQVVGGSGVILTEQGSPILQPYIEARKFLFNWKKNWNAYFLGRVAHMRYLDGASGNLYNANYIPSAGEEADVQNKNAKTSLFFGLGVDQELGRYVHLFAQVGAGAQYVSRSLRVPTNEFDQPSIDYLFGYHASAGVRWYFYRSKNSCICGGR